MIVHHKVATEQADTTHTVALVKQSDALKEKVKPNSQEQTKYVQNPQTFCTLSGANTSRLASTPAGIQRRTFYNYIKVLCELVGCAQNYFLPFSKVGARHTKTSSLAVSLKAHKWIAAKCFVQLPIGRHLLRPLLRWPKRSSPSRALLCSTNSTF